jgi:hypothetical protein
MFTVILVLPNVPAGPVRLIVNVRFATGRPAAVNVGNSSIGAGTVAVTPVTSAATSAALICSIIALIAGVRVFAAVETHG